jgi:hypothetical protein
MSAVQVNSGTARELPRSQHTTGAQESAVVRCSERVYQNLPDSEADLIPECTRKWTSFDGSVFAGSVAQDA